MSDQFDVTKEVVLGSVSFGARGISARSAILSNEAAEKHKSDKKTVKGTVQKLLTSDLKGVASIQQQARLEFKRLTLPWDDNGYRMIPMPMRPQVLESLTRFKTES